mmetsp:Transcript_9716/g.14937  ORF Transcript_9716/g.14937 Transcript_9716/m.14937 type:complete len:162 (-) Transcript_9716:46-531(-)
MKLSKATALQERWRLVFADLEPKLRGEVSRNLYNTKTETDRMGVAGEREHCANKETRHFQQPASDSVTRPDTHTRLLKLDREYEWSEITQHTSEEDLWLVLRGHVYDVTRWAAEHPGGKSLLLGFGGKDATYDFQRTRHSPIAREWLSCFQIGRVKKSKST